jgi:hypothetical protein
MINLFRDFEKDEADLLRINFAMPVDEIYLKRYRPIALTNCSFNIFVSLY